MVKAWLAAAARFFAEFLILLGFFSLAGAFSATLGDPSFASLGLEAAREAIIDYPWALAIAIGLGALTFTMGQVRGGAVLLSLFFLGALIGLFGMAARELLILPERSANFAPRAGQILISNDRAVTAERIEGVTARGVAAVDFAAPFPRLLWAEHSRIDAEGTISLGSTPFSLIRRADQPSNPALALLARLAPPLGTSQATGLIDKLLRTLAFVLLVTGLAAPVLGMRSPLGAFAYALFAIALAIAMEAALFEPSLEGTIGWLLANLGLNLATVWFAIAAEAFVGIVGAALGIILAKRLET